MGGEIAHVLDPFHWWAVGRRVSGPILVVLHLVTLQLSGTRLRSDPGGIAGAQELCLDFRMFSFFDVFGLF